MIKVSDSKSVTVEIESTDYLIDDDESYRSLLIYLTDPNPDLRFSDELFEVDPSIKEAELKEMALRYSEFFKAYSKRRNRRLDSETAAIREGILACESAVTSLESEAEEIGEEGGY